MEIVYVQEVYDANKFTLKLWRQTFKFPLVTYRILGEVFNGPKWRRTLIHLQGLEDIDEQKPKTPQITETLFEKL